MLHGQKEVSFVSYLFFAQTHQALCGSVMIIIIIIIITNQLERKKGTIVIVPKPPGEHRSLLYVGIHAILE